MCPCSKRKRAIAIYTKLGTHILHGRTSACIDMRTKDHGHRVMKCAAGVGMHVSMTAWVSSWKGGWQNEVLEFGMPR